MDHRTIIRQDDSPETTIIRQDDLSTGRLGRSRLVSRPSSEVATSAFPPGLPTKQNSPPAPHRLGPGQETRPERGSEARQTACSCLVSRPSFESTVPAWSPDQAQLLEVLRLPIVLSANRPVTIFSGFHRPVGQSSCHDLLRLPSSCRPIVLSETACGSLFTFTFRQSTIRILTPMWDWGRRDPRFLIPDWRLPIAFQAFRLRGLVCSPWSVVCCLRFLVFGLWSLVFGLRSLFCRLVFGPWPSVCSL